MCRLVFISFHCLEAILIDWDAMNRLAVIDMYIVADTRLQMVGLLYVLSEKLA